MPANFSGSLFVLSQGLLFLALVVRPSPHRWILFTPIAGISCYLVFFTTSGIVTSDYALGSVILAFLCIASDYVLLTDVQRELRAASHSQPPHSLWSRIRWAAQLFASFRGIGWEHEPTSFIRPRPRPSSRAAFVASQLLWAVWYILLFDLANLYSRWNPSFAKGGPSLAAFGWFWRSLNIFGWVVPAVTQMSIQHTLSSAISVATRTSDPKDWPHWFGFWSDAYTIRRFWGRTWHQFLRRPLSSHGKFLAHRVLGFPPGSNPSAYVQLYTAFFLSGLIHYGADYAMLRHWGGGAMRFFLLQAVVITFEDGAIHLAKKNGISGLLVEVLWVYLGLGLVYLFTAVLVGPDVAWGDVYRWGTV